MCMIKKFSKSVTFMTTYHPSLSVFMTSKTPSGVKDIVKVPNKKVAKPPQYFSSPSDVWRARRSSKLRDLLSRRFNFAQNSPHFTVAIARSHCFFTTWLIGGQMVEALDYRPRGSMFFTWESTQLCPKSGFLCTLKVFSPEVYIHQRGVIIKASVLGDLI